MYEREFGKYFRLRRRFLWLALGVAVFAVLDFWLPGSLKAVLSDAAWNVTSRLLPYLLAAMLLALIVTSFQLLFWRRPRCGKSFTVSFWSSWPTSRCKHCRLDADPAQANLPFARIAYEEFVAANAARALDAEPDANACPRWRQHVAGLLQISAALIAIVTIVEFAAALRWLFVEWRQGAEHKSLILGIELTLGQALLLAAIVETVTAVLLWLAARSLERPRRPPPS